MNYDLSPQPTPTLAHRPEEIRSLILLAQQRIEFHREQVDVIAEGLQQVIESHNQITLHYQAMIQNDVNLVLQLSRYLNGARMVGDDVPLPFAPGNEQNPLLTLNGSGPTLALTPEDEARKAQLLGQFNHPGDHKPVRDPSPQYNGKTRHQVVAEAQPIPQATVSVVHYDDGEELPDEAKPGHMRNEPRTAEELRAIKEKTSKAVDMSLLSDGSDVAQVVESDPPKPGAVVVGDEPAPPPATIVEDGLPKK